MTFRATGRSASWRSLGQKNPGKRPAPQLFDQEETADRLACFREHGRRRRSRPSAVELGPMVTGVPEPTRS